MKNQRFSKKSLKIFDFSKIFVILEFIRLMLLYWYLTTLTSAEGWYMCWRIERHGKLSSQLVAMNMPVFKTVYKIHFEHYENLWKSLKIFEFQRFWQTCKFYPETMMCFCMKKPSADRWGFIKHACMIIPKHNIISRPRRNQSNVSFLSF